MEGEVIADPETTPLTVPRGTRVAKTLMWIVTIWLIGWFGMIVSGALSWSNPLAGVMSGAIQGMIVSPFYLILTLPLGLLGWAIGSRPTLRKRRLALSLVLPAIFAFLSAGDAALSRFNPGRRFTALTEVAFPHGAKISQAEFEGGGFADFNYTYVLECPAEETERLIHELKLTLNPEGSSSLAWSSGSGSKVAGWEVAEVWSYTRNLGSNEARVGGADFIELQTDSTRTKVRLICGTI